MKIALIPNYRSGKILEAAKYTVDLLKQYGHEVFVQDKMSVFVNTAIPLNKTELENICDIFIAIGGDGTIIHAAKHANGKPIIGINMGRVGYMAGLEYSEIDSLPSLIDGDCVYENRMLIEIKSGDKVLGEVLNDGVISAKLAKLLDFNVKIDDGEFEYRADGLILSTPTGSTAYSLSAGGPVVDSAMDAIIFTPICPHSLFHRSIVLSGDTLLKVKINLKYDETVILTMDGGTPYEIKRGEEISFTKSKKTVTLMMKEKKNFFEVVNKKLLS